MHNGALDLLANPGGETSRLAVDAMKGMNQITSKPNACPLEGDGSASAHL